MNCELHHPLAPSSQGKRGKKKVFGGHPRAPRQGRCPCNPAGETRNPQHVHNGKSQRNEVEGFPFVKTRLKELDTIALV